MSRTTSLSLDRFEGNGHSIAVMLADDGATINIPRFLLPATAKAGEVFILTIVLDAEATQKLTDETRQVQDRLSNGDPGGDIRL